MTTASRTRIARVGQIDASHRTRVAEIVRGTGAFSDEEAAVALELFDETFLSPASTDSYSFLGAFTLDDELAGYACYGPTPGTDRVFDLYWIAVDPGTQGAGGGTTLLSEVERRLRDVNARMLVVETSSRPGYDGTRRFYERRGYREAARVRHFYAPSDDRVIYLKRFHARPAVGAGADAR